jgi:hypothetical protein
MNEKDKKLMDLIMSDKSKYKIVVDNDSVWVEDTTKDAEKEDINIGDFTENGYYLLVEVFQYLGLNAELC